MLHYDAWSGHETAPDLAAYQRRGSKAAPRPSKGRRPNLYPERRARFPTDYCQYARDWAAKGHRCRCRRPLIVAAAAIAPFASIQLGRIDPFIPVLQTTLSIADLITAALLFAQYSIQPQRALLALASGYIFSGSFAFLQTLAFPGGYAPAGLIGDGPNSPAWIYVLWHTTFPAAIIVYAFSKDRLGVDALPARSRRASIIATLAGVLATIAVLTWIVTTKTEYIPSFYTNDVRVQTQFGN
jgi:hypothetical protein